MSSDSAKPTLWNMLFLCWLIACVSTLGSLFFSEVMDRVTNKNDGVKIAIRQSVAPAIPPGPDSLMHPEMPQKWITGREPPRLSHNFDLASSSIVQGALMELSKST